MTSWPPCLGEFAARPTAVFQRLWMLVGRHHVRHGKRKHPWKLTWNPKISKKWRNLEDDFPLQRAWIFGVPMWIWVREYIFRVHDSWIFSPSFEVNQVTQMISIDFPGCHWSSRRRCCRCSSTRARKAAAVAGENAYISLVLTNIHQTKLFILFGACYHYSTYPPSSCSSSHKVIMFWPYLIHFTYSRRIRIYWFSYFLCVVLFIFSCLGCLMEFGFID